MCLVTSLPNLELGDEGERISKVEVCRRLIYVMIRVFSVKPNLIDKKQIENKMDRFREIIVQKKTVRRRNSIFVYFD